MVIFRDERSMLWDIKVDRRDDVAVDLWWCLNFVVQQKSTRVVGNLNIAISDKSRIRRQPDGLACLYLQAPGLAACTIIPFHIYVQLVRTFYFFAETELIKNFFGQPA